jgi:carbonic anhydrase
MLPTLLIDGYRSFTRGRLTREQARFRELADEGQSPKVMLIGCCDSRVSPEVIFDARPGEVFVVRNVANLVPPYAPDGEYHGTSAALEYAVQQLKVEHIVVLGHARCGGIRAFASRHLPGQKPLSPGDFIGKWISQLETVEGAASAPAGKNLPPEGKNLPPEGKSLPPEGKSLEDYAALLEIASLKKQLTNLRSFPYVEALEGIGGLSLHACHFDIATGQLSHYDEANGALAPVLKGEILAMPRRAEAV